MEQQRAPLGTSKNLTKEQKETLNQLKEELGDLLAKAPNYDDVRILRFLRGKDFDVDDAAEQLENDIKWRAENGVDNILETIKTNRSFQRLLEYWPGRYHKTNREGLPVYYERIGLIDPKALMTAISMEDLVLFHIYIMEYRARGLEQAAKALGRPIEDGNVIVLDCAGLGWKHFYSPGLELVKKINALDEAHYPETLKKLYIVNLPKIGVIIWNMIKPFVAPRTLAKIEILGSCFLPVLEKDIHPDSLPGYLGGRCKCPDGCVPRGTIAERDSYKEQTITAGDTFEHEVRVEHAETVVGWEFKVQAYDVGFAVYRVEGESRREVHPYQTVAAGPSPCSGELTLSDAGAYLLVWDNSYSRMKKKTIRWDVFVQSPPPPAPPPAEAEAKKKKKKRKHHKKKKAAQEAAEETTSTPAP